MSQYLWSPGGVQIGRAAIAITKKAAERPSKWFLNSSLRWEDRSRACAKTVLFLAIKSGRGFPPFTQISRLNSRLKFEVGTYQLIGPINAHASARARRA